MRTAEFSHKVFELPRPIAFVFSGGSCLGALHVGMLRAVREAGIEPDLLVGTSVGAFNAAFVGAGFTPSRVAALEDIWRSLRTRDVFTGLGWRSAVWALTGSGTLASPAGLRAILDRHLPSAHADLAMRRGLEGIIFVLSLMFRHQALAVLPLLRQDHTVLYLPGPCPLAAAPHDFSRGAELIELAYAMAKPFLDHLRIERAGIYGHPHLHLLRAQGESRAGA